MYIYFNKDIKIVNYENDLRVFLGISNERPITNNFNQNKLLNA